MVQIFLLIPVITFIISAPLIAIANHILRKIGGTDDYMSPIDKSGRMYFTDDEYMSNTYRTDTSIGLPELLCGHIHSGHCIETEKRKTDRHTFNSNQKGLDKELLEADDDSWMRG